MGGALALAFANASITMPLTTRLVEVPMRVQIPPRIEEKLKGI
jgi:hypothetical protein